jgi:hypothetical protein
MTTLPWLSTKVVLMASGNKSTEQSLYLLSPADSGKLASNQGEFREVAL